jgi:hypothetical protein
LWIAPVRWASTSRTARLATKNPKREVKEAKYGRCPVCDMALWPDGSCTLPLHTAEKLAAESEAKAKAEVEIAKRRRRGARN